MPHRPTIVAHRGLHATLPENSLAAAAAAWAAGVAWVECDVHEHPAGLFVIHDGTLDRTTAATGPVNDFPDMGLADVRLRDAGGRLTDHTLPRLRDLLDAMPDGAGVVVEIKDVQDYARLARNVAGRRVVVQSFDGRDLLLFSRQDRFVPLAFLAETADGVTASLAMRYPSVHLRHDLLDERTHRQLRRAKKSVGVWTVNAERELHRVVSLGVDVVITDEPALARLVIDDVCGPAPSSDGGQAPVDPGQ